MTETLTRNLYHQELTRELLEKLCETHERDRDFRNATAVACDVHPRRLKNWLLTGAREGQGDLHEELSLRFAKIEGRIRAENIREVLNTTVCTEDTQFGENGKPISSQMVKRSTAGTQWYMERRWRQFRNDWVPGEDDREVLHMFTEQKEGGTFGIEAALAIAAQLAAAMPPQLSEIFIRAGWTPPKMETATHGEK